MLCSMLQGEDSRRTESQIFIRLGNGLTICGLIDFGEAKSIFRDPLDPTKDVDGSVVGKEVIIVLPAATVQKVAFPCVPTGNE